MKQELAHRQATLDNEEQTFFATKVPFAVPLRAESVLE
jgi:hypothetical protein